jgi:hypothetical protein
MALIPSSLPETTNFVSGKILHKESNKGIGDLLVVLFDLDAWIDPENGNKPLITSETTTAINMPDLSVLYTLGDRIGSVVTDINGSFIFEINKRDFNLPSGKEQKPDLLLLVLAPDEPGFDLNKRLLHFSKDIRLNVGTKEAYIIKLPTALLKEKEIPFLLETEETRATAEGKVSFYINQKEREMEYNAGVAEYHGTMANKETEDRKAFRKDFVKKIATDLTMVPLNGQVVLDGDKIIDKNTETVKSGIQKANDALGNVNNDGVPVNLYLTPADKTRLQSFFDNATGGFVEIPESEMGDILFRTNSSENPGTLLVHNNPIANFCSNEGADETCAKMHAGIMDGQDTQPDAPATPVITSDADVTNDNIPSFLGRLLNNMPSPDEVMLPELSKRRADKATIEKSVNDFKLQKGPAEVAAFYDFNSLQIAFDHVWKQLFDENIPNLAYTANSMGKSKFGINSMVTDLMNNGFSLLNTFYTISPVEVPACVAKLFDITKEEYNDMSFAIRDQLVNIATSISLTNGSTIQNLRIIQSLTEQGERLIDSVRHDDYYTLHKTLKDLHDKLTGKYEFTVFAADKDYHSVNFGLLNTYRQQWTPLNYQAGKLIKTMPLSPKEERKYSLKITRNEKRSTKEAKKNNSSISNEQNSTSRIEAEIMAKAQNKTTFNLSAEGDYDIGISSGKATTSFGVEAENESSQNRKDFREAVLKAVQDYKEETSSEITTEETTNNEYNESGTIVNPNDELAVTYLFYELQKRYRISEQIYRVMPVVMVAQEVPSPDQITEAWVISNDWILNRSLLDDTFRPTLSYLANNSVGDDFALRELRKNLRQQRNLVDTLRIEFSAASVEADNRYKALESAINNRIDEEHKERTDGLGNDIWDFFGGGGQDPEAAKARELAAKDAHQYAMEKAEKAAAALRQEVNTLHTITDQYNNTLKNRLDNETKVNRLLVHICKNIFYYMQAIWTMEPPDQRYLRLYKVQVPILELESRSYKVMVQKEDDIFEKFREPGTEKHKALLHGTLKHNPNGNPFNYKSLVEVADVDTLLGFKGNYMIFPMKEHNALTEFMAAPYIDSAFGAMDPDELSNINLDEYSKYVCCLHDQLKPEEFDALKPQLKAWLEKLLATPLRNGDEIVVPTNSLFIEALVDENPILEDFKLKHRELDVFKVQEEVRRAGLENIRLAARLLNAEREDPDIEKKIVVEGNLIPQLDVNNP